MPVVCNASCLRVHRKRSQHNTWSRDFSLTRDGDLRYFFFSSRRRHTRWTGDWSSDVCSSDLGERDRRPWPDRGKVRDNPRARPLSGLMSTAEQRASRAHRRGVLAGNAGHPAVGARLVRTGLAALGWREEDDGGPERHGALAARMVITLAYLEAEQGRADYGLRLLDRAELAVAAADRGHLHSQRGLMLLRTGRWAAALGQLTTAEPLAGGDPELQARVLLNRSVVHLNTGDVRLARGDLRRSASIAADAGLALLAAKATQNLGYCDLLAGDIPAALHQFDVAARAYEATAPGMLPVLATDRARALLAA